MGKRETILEVREIDQATGEVIASGSRKKWFSNFRSKQGYLFKPQAHFVRVFTGTKLPKEVTVYDAYKLYLLIDKLENGTNRLVYRSDHTNKSMHIGHIAAYLGLTYNATLKFVTRMIHAGVMAKGKITVGHEKIISYYFNPLYYIRGKWLSYELYTLFQDQLDTVLPEWVKRKFAEEHRDPDDPEDDGIDVPGYENVGTDYKASS
ncbi:hypothetical protein [Acidaminococcus massiliensis]|jgi:hypothetical protein|uniref:hypothetical protein n=1 Tax=Acidaminococcus massiliensis TaxID=1852375 RepID=UPI0022E07298|nr:hypothetical protein [Acidaminococcus massiliensis]